MFCISCTHDWATTMTEPTNPGLYEVTVALPLPLPPAAPSHADELLDPPRCTGRATPFSPRKLRLLGTLLKEADEKGSLARGFCLKKIMGKGLYMKRFLARLLVKRCYKKCIFDSMRFRRSDPVARWMLRCS